MKKVILTTEQMNKISEFVINESDDTVELNEQADNDRYEMKCKFDFNYPSNLLYKGGEIDDIGYGAEYTLSFRIDQEHRSWGIKNISVYDVQGPEELEVEVVYYPQGSDQDSDSVTEYAMVKVDWDSINYDSEEPRGMVGIDEDVEIELGNDSEGNFIVNEIRVITYSI